MPNNNEELPPELERYLALCKRTYERLVAEGKWLWDDSPNSDDMVESEDNPKNI